jgi:Condensation domain/AMP-binding enzyme
MFFVIFWAPHTYELTEQVEYDNARKRNVSKIDPAMSRFGATQWDTHEGYFVTIKSKSPLDLQRMTKAFAEAVNRHGSLRTTFHWDEEKGKLMQTIHPSVQFENSTIVDLTDEPDAYKKAYNMSIAANMNPNFHLDKLPLVSAIMYKLGGEDYGFNITVHHIMTDETSLGIFFFELFELYIHGIDTLPPVQLHYSDFSDWLIRTADRRAEIRDEQLEYWTKNLEGVQPLQLTLARPSEVEQSPVTQIDASINPESLEKYSQFISTSSVTPFAAYFAIYNVLLYKYSAQSSFVVGTAVTQRSIAQLQEVIGFFANMLPIRTTIDEDLPFSEYLKSFKDDLMNGLAHDDVTYEDIVAQTKTSSQDRSYFKHLFAPGGLNLSIINKLNTTDIYPTSILSLPNGEEKYEFLLTVHYKTGETILRFDNYLYSEETARQFLDAFCGLVDTLGNNPDIKIRDISAVSDNELTRLVKELSTSGPVEPVERCIHHLFEEQTLRTPTSIAVEFESDYMTYSQLNSKANRLARILIQQGVGPDSVVALCFDRGIPQILAILAVLKAGGAFLPIDPDDPAIRKELLVAECQAKVLLTTYSHHRDFDKSLASKVIVSGFRFYITCFQLINQHGRSLTLMMLRSKNV